MDVEIIAIGNELLSGATVDTNTPFISEHLMSIGMKIAFKTTVGDIENHVISTIREALNRVDMVIVTGGLGPTSDDVTRKAISRVCELRLVLNEKVLEKVRERFERRGIPMPRSAEVQALIPKGATLLPNNRGSAWGVMIEQDNKVLIAMPGVPDEMRGMFLEEALPIIKSKWKGKYFTENIVLKVTGIGETRVEELISDIVKSRHELKIAYLPQEAEVWIKLTSEGREKNNLKNILDETKEKVIQQLGIFYFGENNDALEGVVGGILKEKGFTLSVAESCTGGLIGHRITSISGSSLYFERGIISYSNEAKISILGVPRELIEKYGAVSTPVAKAMAQGVRRISKTHLGLGVTGIAGPEGGSPDKPVGTVFVALAYSNNEVKCEKYQFLGGRYLNKLRASQAALDMVRQYLIKGA